MPDITTLDRRTNAFRPDLADASLRPFVKADRYVEPTLCHTTRGVLPLLATPEPQAKQVSDIRYGEFLDLIEKREDGYAWVQNRFDRTVGYIASADALSEEIGDLSWRVTALSTFIYDRPEKNARPLDRLTLGSFLRVKGEEGAFLSLASGGFVPSLHAALGDEAIMPDYAFTAGRLLNVPYIRGGRTSLGLDAPALVQVSLEMAGIEVPREIDQQRAIIGHDLPEHWRDVAWRRGDIVFFPNHVALMVNGSHALCACEDAMAVAVAPLTWLVDHYGIVTAMAHPHP